MSIHPNPRVRRGAVRRAIAALIITAATFAGSTGPAGASSSGVPAGPRGLAHGGGQEGIVDPVFPSPAPEGGALANWWEPADPSADPLGLLADHTATHAVSLGQDRIAVWVCDVPLATTDEFYVQFGGRRVAIDPRSTAAIAGTMSSDWLRVASQGRFSAVFTGVGRIPLGVEEGPHECLQRAMAATGAPFTNVLVVDDVPYNGGFGGPGTWGMVGVAPSASGRGMWVGGAAIVGDVVDHGAGRWSETPSSAATVVHELGHTLHWPHSFTGPSEYDNPVDLMSDSEVFPQHTLAVNRYAAGWIDPAQVVVHRGGSRTVTLTPPGSAGVQMLAVPDGDPLVFTTFEARPRIGHDRNLLADGVAVHVVDQRPETCSTGRCTGLERRQRPAGASPGGVEHVLTPGRRFVVGSTSVHVDRRNLDGSYTVTVGDVVDRSAEHRAFVRAAYVDFTGREPSAGELAAWADRLANGAGSGHLLESLAGSDAWLGATVDRFYRDTLGRDGEASGRAYWIDALRRRSFTVAEAAAQFYASEEYFTRFGARDVTTWIGDLYPKLLGRTAEPAGSAYWVGVASAAGRPAVSAPFFQSEESRRVRVQRLYQVLLGRDPDPSGLAYWAGQIVARGDVALAVDLASSPEYAERAARRFGA